MEIPPRARRRGARCFWLVGVSGNTSACAEKSSEPGLLHPAYWKYLRVRGEEPLLGLLVCGFQEIPPRARRRDEERTLRLIGFGNTSACAEKRRSKHEVSQNPWKYLRVRGEETKPSCREPISSEIPPRARRRAFRAPGPVDGNGNTSACAEKRSHRVYPRLGIRKYLRVRGEESPFAAVMAMVEEIPPRARRRVEFHGDAGCHHGNTSACAEKSCYIPVHGGVDVKYLRVRGEETS